MTKKTISVVIPCYNEETNVKPMADRIDSIFQSDLPDYDYELIFIDNKSQDNTRTMLRGICSENPKVKAIFNIANFGQFNSPYYALLQSSGDCTVFMCADFQEPPEYIPAMVHKWEEGSRVVCMIKSSSRENPVMYFFRSVYYRMIKKMSNVDQIEHFTGFGLYDKSFIDVLRQLKDPTPFLRGIVAEYAPDRAEIEYEQQQRKSGRTKTIRQTRVGSADKNPRVDF